MDSTIFKVREYDPFIDFLKGISILFVIFTHNLPGLNVILFCLWGDWAVPFFLIIQCFHYWKKDSVCLTDYLNVYTFEKIVKRVIKPFFILLLLQILIISFISFIINVTHFAPLVSLAQLYTLKKIFLGIAMGGGYGPGSFYIWIYLQMFFIAPFLIVLSKKTKYKWAFFVLIAIICEIICSIVGFSDWAYRLLAFRYLFLVYCAYLLYSRPFRLNFINVFLSVLSIIFIILFNYSSLDFQPIFCNSLWKSFHWICYFYPTYLLLYFIRQIYVFMKDNKISLVFRKLGIYSYEIFLAQMFVFGFMPVKLLSVFIPNNVVMQIVRIILTTTLSIVPVLIYKKIKNSKKNVFKNC